jgi:hypothetical protein
MSVSMHDPRNSAVCGLHKNSGNHLHSQREISHILRKAKCGLCLLIFWRANSYSNVFTGLMIFGRENSHIPRNKSVYLDLQMLSDSKISHEVYSLVFHVASCYSYLRLAQSCHRLALLKWGSAAGLEQHAETTQTPVLWAGFELALRYKPEGRGIDSRWCDWSFSWI